LQSPFDRVASFSVTQDRRESGKETVEAFFLHLFPTLLSSCKEAAGFVPGALRIEDKLQCEMGHRVNWDRHHAAVTLQTGWGQDVEIKRMLSGHLERI